MQRVFALEYSDCIVHGLKANRALDHCLWCDEIWHLNTKMCLLFLFVQFAIPKQLHPIAVVSARHTVLINLLSAGVCGCDEFVCGRRVEYVLSEWLAWNRIVSERFV
jgi:hypothetical protein